MYSFFSRYFNGKTPLFDRLIKGFGANALGKFWGILLQLISVPFLTSSWGIDGYGLWLMIVTIPVYICLTDLGLASAAAVDMTAGMARNDRVSVISAFQSVWVFVTCFTLIAVLAVMFFVLKGGGYFDNFKNVFSTAEIQLTVVVVSFVSLVTIQMNVLRTFFQSTHRYAVGTLIYDFVFLVEGLSVVFVAFLSGGIFVAALAMLCIRIVGFFVCVFYIKRNESWFVIGCSYFKKETFFKLLKPSLSVMLLNFASAISLQGMVVAIGWAMGPAAAAVFSTTRMVTRIPLQIPSLLIRASIPELTRAYVSSDFDLAKKITRANLFFSMAAVLPSVVVLCFFGSYFIDLISLGSILVDNYLVALFCVAVLFNSIWLVFAAGLNSINRQGDYAWLVFVVYSICIVVPCWFVESYFYPVIAVAVSEFLICIFVVFRGRSGFAKIC